VEVRRRVRRTSRPSWSGRLLDADRLPPTAGWVRVVPVEMALGGFADAEGLAGLAGQEEGVREEDREGVQEVRWEVREEAREAAREEVREEVREVLE